MTRAEVLFWINHASYEELFRRWRIPHASDWLFLDDALLCYYAEVMEKKRVALAFYDYVRIRERVYKEQEDEDYISNCKSMDELYALD